MIRATCHFCGFEGTWEPGGCCSLWRSQGGTSDTYSCTDAHECRWRMQMRLQLANGVVERYVEKFGVLDA